MVILGLTGSIGMGKSTAAGALRRMRIPVWDSDGAVHRLLGQGGAAVTAVEKIFPGVVKDGEVDRQALAAHAFAHMNALTRLEGILHPMVQALEHVFLSRAAFRRETLVVLEVPLLFETGADFGCDATILVTAPKFLQEMRVLGRPGMTRDRLQGIRERQMPDAEKRRRANFIIQTGRARGFFLRRLTRIVTLMRDHQGQHWPPRARKARSGAQSIERAMHARNRP